MRITDSFRSRTIITNLNQSRERMTNLQEQLATGKKLNRPSDNPTDMAIAMRMKTLLENNNQYNGNIDNSIAAMNAQENAMNDVYEMMVQLKEIAIEGASDSVSVRNSLALQVGQMFENLIEIANSKVDGKYIFGGTETLAQPFIINGAGEAEYKGNQEPIFRQVNENTRVESNLNGIEIFMPGKNGTINIFQTMIDLKTDLENDTDPNQSQKINAKIDDIGNGIEQTLQNFLKIGTRKQLVLFNQDRFISQDIQIRASMSALEDTDFGEAFINFKSEENALNSALSAGARVISPSLLDYLGGV